MSSYSRAIPKKDKKKTELKGDDFFINNDVISIDTVLKTTDVITIDDVIRGNGKRGEFYACRIKEFPNRFIFAPTILKEMLQSLIDIVGAGSLELFNNKIQSEDLHVQILTKTSKSGNQYYDFYVVD